MSRLRTDVAVIPTRLVKGGGDRQPEALSRGQARVIPEDANRAKPVPRLRETVESQLRRACDVSVGAAAAG